MDKHAHAVLLRGINLGPRNKVPMPALRTALTGAGFARVATLLQSGNVVVVDGRGSAAVADAVRKVVIDEFGVDVACLSVDRKTVAEIVAECPMPEQAASNGQQFVVVFLERPVSKARLSAFDPQQMDPDRIRVGRHAVYQWCPRGFHLAPQVLPQIEKRWQITATVRNWNTTTKLLEMLEAAEFADPTSSRADSGPSRR